MLETVVEPVDKIVDRLLTADPLEEIGTTERPETRRMLQEAPVCQRGGSRTVVPCDVGLRTGIGYSLPAQGGRVLLTLAGCGARLLACGGLLLRHGFVHSSGTPRIPPTEGMPARQRSHGPLETLTGDVTLRRGRW